MNISCKLDSSGFHDHRLRAVSILAARFALDDSKVLVKMRLIPSAAATFPVKEALALSRSF